MSCKCQHKPAKKVKATTVTEAEPEATHLLTDFIKERIAIFSKNAQCKTGSKVSAYLFKNKLVYVFEEGSCGADMTAPVFDKDCNKLGYLGGFVGNVTIQGTNFSEAVLQEVVWKQKNLNK